MAHYDLIDGGIPVTFLDGPKKGHLGVVTPQTGGEPPAELTFLDDMRYLRSSKTKVKAHDANMQPVKYRGVAYRLDPKCGFVQRMMFEIDQAKQDLAHGRVETQ